MALVMGQASSASRTTTAASATVAPPAQRITITPDPSARRDSRAAEAFPVPASYVTVPGLISGLYEQEPR
jgi:hypothetical protein